MVTIPKLKKHTPVLVAPLIGLKSMTPPQLLLAVYSNYMATHSYPPKMRLNRALTYEQALLEELQERYPGRYRVEEYYNPVRQRLDFRIVFEHERDEMWWKLKHE